MWPWCGGGFGGGGATAKAAVEATKATIETTEATANAVAEVETTEVDIGVRAVDGGGETGSKVGDENKSLIQEGQQCSAVLKQDFLFIFIVWSKVGTWEPKALAT